MGASAKFLFDVDFGPNAKPAEETVTLAALQAAIAEAEARGFRNGVASAEAQARAEAERRSSVALERVGLALDRLVNGLKAVEGRLQGEAVESAVAVARQRPPRLIAARTLAAIGAPCQTASS